MFKIASNLLQCTRTLSKTRFPFSIEADKVKQISIQMNEKIQTMKQSIAKTTPRSFSAFFLIASIPAFYFINELMQREYTDPDFTNNSNRFYKYYFLYNLTFFGCSLFLSRFNFHSPSSKFTLPKTPVKSAIIPLTLSLLGLMLPETDNKHLAWPAIVTQVSTMVAEGVMANKGMLPFWFYSHRHYIGLFYFIMFWINYTAMSRLQKRRVSHPHQFVEIMRSQ